jgi:predicted patatin/cPLA2 family phospholipase
MRALVLEGGALRAIFTAGVLDAMAQSGEPPFDLVVGTSAGAYCASSFLAGQHGRIKNIVERYMNSSKYVNPARMIVGGSLIDQDFLIHEVTRTLLPLDVDALKASPSTFEVVTTHAQTGEPCYLPAQEDDCIEALHATVAMPFFYRGGPVEFRSEEHFDGSLTEPVPLSRAIARGATEITVVINRSVSWEPPPLSLPARLVLRAELGSYKGAYKAMLNLPQAYRSSRYLLDSPPRDVKIRLFRPPASYAVQRFTRDTSMLEQGYRQGREAYEHSR